MRKFTFVIFLTWTVYCSGQTYSGSWALAGTNSIKSSQLILDITPRRFFYEALGSVTIPDGLRLLSGTCVDANAGGVTCTLIGAGGESFKLIINSDANGILVYFQKDATIGEDQQASFIGLR